MELLNKISGLLHQKKEKVPGGVAMQCVSCTGPITICLGENAHKRASKESEKCAEKGHTIIMTADTAWGIGNYYEHATNTEYIPWINEFYRV